jgi:hypothetical protein
MSYFVFVEFGSAQVIDFLSRLRNALQGESVSSPVHVTLRGPYKEAPKREQLEDYAERLRGYGVKIGDHGYFSTPNGFSVFLRAECSVFRELWDKPDYQVPLESIQPHITLFESADRQAAQSVRDFLRQERLLIHTYSIYLSVYKSKATQADFFERPTVSPSGKAINRDIWRIPEGILDRAAALGTRIATPQRDG